MMGLFKTIGSDLVTIWNDCRGEFKPKSLVPKHEIDAFVHTFYPAVVAFFQTEEGRREFEEWKAKKDAERDAEKKEKAAGMNPTA